MLFNGSITLQNVKINNEVIFYFDSKLSKKKAKVLVFINFYLIFVSQSVEIKRNNPNIFIDSIF